MKTILKACLFVALIGVFFGMIGSTVKAEGSLCSCNLVDPNLGSFIESIQSDVFDEAACTERGKQAKIEGKDVDSCLWEEESAISGKNRRFFQTSDIDAKIKSLNKLNLVGDDVPKGERIQVAIGGLIKIALGLVGTLALVVFVYGGVTWMFAEGKRDRYISSFKMIIWAALGLMVIFSSYAIITFIFEAVK